MNPLRRFGLAHAEHAAMEEVRGMLLEVDENEQQAILRCRQGTGRIGRITSCLPAPSMERPLSHVGQERGFKGWDEDRKLVHGQARQIEYLGGMRWNIAIT